MQFAKDSLMFMSHIKNHPALAFLTAFFVAPWLVAEEPASEETKETSAPAAESSASGPLAELTPITDRIVAALREGLEVDPADLAALDALIEKYRGDPSEDVAQIFLTKAAYVLQVEGDREAALPIFNEIAATFVGTEPGDFASRIAGMIAEELAEEARQANFVGSEAPELDFTWVSEGEAMKLSDLRGKVVVLDFWATWCGPCVRSFPQVRELTDHYAESDVAVIGVTSLQGQVHGLDDSPINTRGDAAKEHALMTEYMSEYDINWRVVFTEQEVFNDEYGVTGIPHMAIIAPDGTVRHTGMHPAAPKAEKLTKIDAILEEFGLPVPSSS